MWTLFFAGNDFAPKTMIDDMPVQDYLQSHFLGAMSKVAETLKDSPNVLGFDILNEPSVGFVGVQDVRDIGPVRVLLFLFSA
jgi:aryl-phospho-beta-D-glucosidase BglC (GH1 family)